MVEVEENKRDMITEAREAAAELERASANFLARKKELEEFETRRILGGKALAGENTPKPVEETPQEYAKRLLRGELKK